MSGDGQDENEEILMRTTVSLRLTKEPMTQKSCCVFWTEGKVIGFAEKQKKLVPLVGGRGQENGVSQGTNDD